MKKYLLDTGVAGAFVARRSGIAERVAAELKNGSAVGICIPVLGELSAGAANSDRVTERKKELELRTRKLRLWPFDRKSAEKYGDIYAELRRKGRPIQQIDMQIAAIALTLGNCVLVTMDSDFAAIDGLVTEDWTLAPSP